MNSEGLAKIVQKTKNVQLLKRKIPMQICFTNFAVSGFKMGGGVKTKIY